MIVMDEKTRNQIIILVLGVIIGATGSLANSLILWNASMMKEKSDIAEGLFLDVSSLESSLAIADQEFATPNDSCDNDIFVQSNPLYPDNGLYFSVQKDIPKMDRKISKDTFAFYEHLLTAERDRKLIFEIQRQGDLRNLTVGEVRRQQILTENIAREVNLSVRLLPSLKQELDAVT
jgi:hypothetical protein